MTTRAEIISLDDLKPHMSGEARCLLCGHKWVSVSPTGTIWLECSECHTMKGTYIYPAIRDGAHWTCNCGNDLFYATPDGFYCPNCGEWQRGF